MTQVSRIPLRKEIEKRIFEIFLSSLAKVRHRQEVENFINDLLSPTEKTMLAKRISIAFLLAKKYDQRTISKTLKVGLETVSKVSRSMRSGKGGYRMVAGNIMRNEKLNEFVQKIDDFINDVFPPKGRDWRKWRKDRWEEKKRNQKAF